LFKGGLWWWIFETCCHSVTLLCYIISIHFSTPPPLANEQTLHGAESDSHGAIRQFDAFKGPEGSVSFQSSISLSVLTGFRNRQLA
jgi:hypothetical protein